MKQYLFLVVFLFCLSLVMAVPPQTFLGTIGFGISTPALDSIPYETDLVFPFHVFNSTSGLLIDNNTASCSLDFYNSTDELGTYYNYVFDRQDFEFNVSAGTFNSTGNYFYIIECNSSDVGGGASLAFLVTPNGHINSIQDNLTFCIIFGSLFLIIVLLFVMALSVRNPMLKVFFWGLSLLILIVNIGFTLGLINTTLIGYNSLTSGYSSIYTLALIITAGLGLALILYLIVIVLKYFSNLRYGNKDF